MRKIYSQAEQVVAWLGEENADTGLAFHLIGKWAEMYASNAYDSTSLEALTADSCKAFISMAKRPFWDRVWVVQEVLLAQRTIFKCGSYEISFPELRYACQVINDFIGGWNDISLAVELRAMNREMYLYAPTTFSVLYMIHKNMFNGLTIPNLVSLTTSMEATDPRDMVYALLGLVDPETDKTMSRIVLDYQLSVKEAYEAVVMCITEATKDLQVIAMAGFGANSSTASLPSWVPYFAYRTAPVFNQRGLRISDLSLYDRLDAADGALADCSFSKEKHEFKTRGIVCDKLSWCIGFEGDHNSLDPAINYVQDIF